MSIAAGLHSLLIGDAGVAALIGDRNFPHEAPQDADTPFTVYRLGEEETPRDLSGSVVSRRYRYDIVCSADTFDAAKELSIAVKQAVGGTENRGRKAVLDGTPVIMFWADNPETDSHVSAQDRMRFQVGLDLVILEQ